MRNVLATIAEMIAAVAVAIVVAAVSLKAIADVNWPAYPSSNQLHALTTVGQVGCMIGLIGAGWVWRRSREAGDRRWRLPARLGALVFVSAFCVVTLGMPWAPPSCTSSGSRSISSSAPNT